MKSVIIHLPVKPEHFPLSPYGVPFTSSPTASLSIKACRMVDEPETFTSVRRMYLMLAPPPIESRSNRVLLILGQFVTSTLLIPHMPSKVSPPGYCSLGKFLNERFDIVDGS